MKRGRFTESQIVSILKEADAGTKVKEVPRSQRSDQRKELIRNEKSHLSYRNPILNRQFSI